MKLCHGGFFSSKIDTVEPRYSEVLGTMKITLLYQVSHYIRVKKTKPEKYKELGPGKLVVIRGFCYISDLFITRFHCSMNDDDNIKTKL